MVTERTKHELKQEWAEHEEVCMCRFLKVDCRNNQVWVLKEDIEKYLRSKTQMSGPFTDMIFVDDDFYSNMFNPSPPDDSMRKEIGSSVLKKDSEVLSDTVKRDGLYHPSSISEEGNNITCDGTCYDADCPKKHKKGYRGVL